MQLMVPSHQSIYSLFHPKNFHQLVQINACACLSMSLNNVIFYFLKDREDMKLLKRYHVLISSAVESGLVFKYVGCKLLFIL